MIKWFNLDRTKMILLWVTLLLLHHGYALVPVVTVQLGEPATFTCALPEDKDSTSRFYWYKQNAGDTLILIVMLHNFAQSTYGPEFSASRLNVMINNTISTLTILETTQEDEGMYHCVLIDWNKNTWHATYLSLKDNNEETSNLIVVQQPSGSDQLHHGHSVTLQCALLSHSPNKTCSEDLRVFWFRSRSDKVYPDMIYMNEDEHDKCEKKPDSQNRCVFSRNISSSDPGTYYCAVATCGQIIFGNGTKVENDQTADPKPIALAIACICLAVSVIVNVVFFCYRTPTAGIGRTYLQARQPQALTTEDGQDLNYAALYLSGGKSTRGKKRELKMESVYSHVKL